MTTLIAASPAADLVPLTIGTVTLSERIPEAITAIAPYAGQTSAVSKALKEATGVGFPKPGRAETKAGIACVWSGREQAFLLGPALAGLDGAAVTDQSDAWAVLVLEGAGAEAVLARLVPVDLRARAFPVKAAARTQLVHMHLSIRRSGAAAFELMVFRSMAATAVHEIEAAMTSVAAQGL